MGVKAVPISEQLRRAILASGRATHDIAMSAGVSPPALYRFMSGQRGLSLDSIDKISRILPVVLYLAVMEEVEDKKTGTHD